MTPAIWSPQHVLDPTPPEARDWLDRELHGSDYRDPWLDSAVRWVVDHLRSLLDGAANPAGLSPVVTVLVALVVVALLTWVLPRVRRESSVARRERAVLSDPTITARTYRDRASMAMRDRRYDHAILDGFRAIATDMSTRGLFDDAPGRTAHEVSLSLAPHFPEHADRLARAADLFDSVRYGHRRADADQAGQVQHLDAELVDTRPVLSVPARQDVPV
jgi:hypothetical protein